MQRRALFLAFAATLMAALAFGANGAHASMPAVLFTKPIVFAARSQRVVMPGTIGVHQAHQWIVTGRPGQRVTVVLKGKTSTFDVCYDKQGGSKPSWQKYPGKSSDLSSWTGMLPKSGRIMIEVFGSADRERYELHVKRS